ncbi:hypothetical protein DPEC_G00259880 [Dallia pectoralis]|uniref:Uncharacterized protein n=1 Tax=Dallia pectoralis TaxID=75939 RepID=A0ACC2FR80_DALPE|nr:hypothetical protein DPEC_G00259880 [Dallia pectoralis]
MADVPVFSLPPPDYFLPLPGEPVVPWNQWRTSFELYLLAIGLDNATSARKRAILLHLLGAEGNRIFNTLDGTLDTYNAVARPQQTRQQRHCGNCGSTRHATRAQDCPARGQTCRRCQKPNHFARWCRSAPADYSEQSHDPVVPVRTIGPHPGTFSSSLHFYIVDRFPFHITRHGENIMGLDLFLSLGFTLQDNNGAQILQADGIIEPIDASPWVSNLVIARKKSGGLRVCVDLRQVNKAVVPDKYPLPTTEELTTHFSPGSFLSWTFITHTGLYRYTRMPFGLSSAPSCLQKIMSTILASCPGTVAYLDDIVVHGPDVDTHNVRLEQVFESLSRHHVTLNTEKSTFSVPAIDFVGFRVSADGISPLQSNVAAISAVPNPTTASQLASFLGMTAYYMRFLPQYSSVTAPLRMLLRQDAPWTWTSECQAGFDELKRLLTTSPILAHFQLDCPTFVTCDASAVALGAVLSLLHDGAERPVAFAPGRSAPPSRNTQWALTALMSTSGGGHRPLRLYRWSDRLQQYDFQLQFTPGKTNVVADFLSRPAAIQCSAVSTEDEEEVVHLVHSPLKDTVSLRALESASAAEPVFSMLRDYIRHGWPARVPPELEPYHRVKHELSCWGGACVARGLCAVIPVALRGWKTGPPASTPLQPVDWPSAPWDHLQLDICGELHNVPHHQRFLVVVYDLPSKWPEVAPMGTVNSAAVVNFLDHLFSRWGLPRAITTDNGPQFLSLEFTTYLANKGVTHIRTSVYHPQANGGVERFNQSLKNVTDPPPLQSNCPLYNWGLPCRTHAEKGACASPDETPSTNGHVPTPMPSSSEGSRQETTEFHEAEVSRQLGPASFQLTDGSRWHASCLRRVPSPFHQPHLAGVEQSNPATEPAPHVPDPMAAPLAQAVPAAQDTALALAPLPGPLVSEPRPVRVRTRPGHFEDFVATFHV